MRWEPRVIQSVEPGGALQVAVGHPLADKYLEFRGRPRPAQHPLGRGVRSQGLLLGGGQDARARHEC